MYQTTREERVRARKAAGVYLYDSCPVEVLAGAEDASCVRGQKVNWTYRLVQQHDYPMPYGSAGQSPMERHLGRYRVIVGERWLRPIEEV